MLKETIFYSFRIHNEPEILARHSSLNDIIISCRVAKDRVIDLLKRNGIITHEIIRPEIYKHRISFNLLPHFKPGIIHLIFKPIEHIRILKNSYNISIVPWEFDTINLASQSGIPFTNHYRMLSLLDEIWVLTSRQQDILNRHHFFNTYTISQHFAAEGISDCKIIDRIHSVMGKTNA